MLKEYTEVKKVTLDNDKEYYYYRIDGNKYGLVFEMSFMDTEAYIGCERPQYNALMGFIETIPNDVLFKFHYKSELCFDAKEGESREDFKRDGYRKKRLYFSLNFKTGIIPYFWSNNSEYNIKKTVKNVTERISFEPLIAEGVTVENINPADCPFFDYESISIKLLDDCLLDINTHEYIQVIKLENLSVGDEENMINFHTLEQKLLLLHYDSEVVSSFKKLNQTVSEKDLKIKISAKTDIKTDSDVEIKNAREKALKDVELYGQSIYKMDLSIILRAESRARVTRIANELEVKLKELGDFKKQSNISLNPYESTRVNTTISSLKKERTPVVPFFIPIRHHGDENKEVEKRSIPFLRYDDSLTYFPLYTDKRYFNHGMVIGNTGYGKSVALNLFIADILKDKKNSILLADVKSSHNTITEKNNGVNFKIDTDSKTGLSAFNLLKKGNDRKIKSHIVNFVVCLCEGEDTFKDENRSQIESLVIDYIKKNKENSSLQGFIEYVKGKDIKGFYNLNRWGKDGLYGNIFAENTLEDNRLTYFNLIDVNDAEKKFFTKAIFNVFLTQIYLKLYTKSSDELLFILVDEMPFIIRSSFYQVSGLAASIRSMGGILIFLAQLSTQLLGPKKETDLFSFTSWKLLLSVDNKDKGNTFQELTQISDENYYFLKQKTKNEKGTRFSVLKEDNQEKIIGIRLSNKEYWESTTKPSDKKQIDLIRKEFGLSEIKSRKAIELIKDL
jgi:hypothetical protein